MAGRLLQGSTWHALDKDELLEVPSRVESCSAVGASQRLGKRGFGLRVCDAPRNKLQEHLRRILVIFLEVSGSLFLRGNLLKLKQ